MAACRRFLQGVGPEGAVLSGELLTVNGFERYLRWGRTVELLQDNYHGRPIPTAPDFSER